MTSPWSPEPPRAGLAVPKESGSDALGQTPLAGRGHRRGETPSHPRAMRLLES